MKNFAVLNEIFMYSFYISFEKIPEQKKLNPLLQLALND